MQSDDDCSERGIAFDASFLYFIVFPESRKVKAGLSRYCPYSRTRTWSLYRACTLPVTYNLHIAKPVQKEYHCMYICLDSPGNSR